MLRKYILIKKIGFSKRYSKKFNQLSKIRVVGSYAIHNNLVEVCIMFLFGILGYLARKFDLNPAAIVLGLILGPIGERGLRRSLMLNDGDPSILFSTPLCWILIILCVLGVMSPIVMSKLEKKVQNQ